MPQMHPLFWFILFIFSCLMSLFTMAIIFFSEEKPNSSIKPVNSLTQEESIWKW